MKLYKLLFILIILGCENTRQEINPICESKKIKKIPCYFEVICVDGYKFISNKTFYITPVQIWGISPQNQPIPIKCE